MNAAGLGRRSSRCSSGGRCCGAPSPRWRIFHNCALTTIGWRLWPAADAIEDPVPVGGATGRSASWARRCSIDSMTWEATAGCAHNYTRKVAPDSRWGRHRPPFMGGGAGGNLPPL